MMRAREFIVEREGKIGKRRQWATRGLHKFKDADGRDRFYELNRVMMAVAMADGETPIAMPESSWVHNTNTAHPYSAVEQAMLKQAYKAVGSSYRDLNNGDLKSTELPSTNKQSPIQGFQGYPR
jgi:hypothetical protein